MSKRSKFGWMDFLLGILLIALGVYTFFNPMVAMSGAVIIYSVLAIVTGITDIVFFVRMKSATGFGPTTSLVAGILSVLAGFMLLLNPVLGSWLFGLVFSVWFIAHGISRLANYKFIRATAGKASAIISVVLNSLAIILGVLMLVSPSLSAISLGYIVAFVLVLHGMGDIAESFSEIGAEGTGVEESEWH